MLRILADYLSSCFCFDQVDRIKCPILLIVGEDDQNCPASESAEDVSRGASVVS